MSISRLAASIAESPTLKLTDRARVLKEKGESVIHLGAGEPKSKIPPEAILHSVNLLNTGEIRYTPTGGTAELKKAIIQYTEKNYNKSVSTGNIIVSAGAKQAVFILLTTILNPKDEVVILAPYWVSYPELVRLNYAKPVIVQPPAGQIEPRMQDITKVCTSKTRAIIVNSPNNPSGAVYSQGLMSELVTFCEKKDVYLISDDIYHKLIFDGTEWVPAYQFTQKDIEDSNVIVVNGVSKLYAMTGFRIGWTIGPRKIVAVMNNVQGQTSSCTSAVSQAATVGALTGDQRCVEELRLTLQHNRDLMVQELKSIPSVQIHPPQGTFYCFPDFSACNKSSEELSQFLLDKVMVVGVPGKEFGLEGHLRLSFCGSAKDITEGIRRIKWALDPNAPHEFDLGNRKITKDQL